MKKCIFLTFFCALITYQAKAQDVDLVFGIIEDSVTAESQTDQKPENKVADDKGGFSFFNLSFIKKPLSFFSSDDKKTEAEKQQQNTQSDASQTEPAETPLQRAIRLAESGDAENALGLGYMYLYGQNGVETDYQKAFHFYELAAKQNNVIALNNLGSLYFNGIGTDVNYDTAAQLFKKAAELGSDDAAVNLAFIYLSSEQEKFIEPAIDLFEQASKTGNNTAKFMLGYAYHKGVGVEYDPYEAVKLIREAADAGFDEAQYTLANIYIDGEGIAQNYNNAVKYYRKAIAQGHVEAMVDLATILAEGKMFPKNLIQAHILCNIASVYGVEQAAQNRDTIESALKLEELLEAQNAAEQYHENPSELTQYIRQTYGSNVRKYIDNNQTKKGKKVDKKA